MAEGNRSTYFLEADEIDHLTIRYTDFGEALNKEKASAFIRRYCARYSELRAKINFEDISLNALDEKTESELYNALIILRDFLLGKAFE